jgi:hypothetical protein
MPHRRQLTRRIVYRKPQGNELKAPFGELVITGRPQMAALQNRDQFRGAEAGGGESQP